MHLASGGVEGAGGEISKVLFLFGFKKLRMRLGLFTLHSPAGV